MYKLMGDEELPWMIKRKTRSGFKVEGSPAEMLREAVTVSEKKRKEGRRRGERGAEGRAGGEMRGDERIG